MGAALKSDEGYTQAQHARFRAVNAHVLGIEGGFSDRKADLGGPTNDGVSLRFAIAAGSIDANHDGFKDLDLNMDGVIDGHDIRLITPEIATGLFFKNFWLDTNIYLLPAPFDAACYDEAVNAGEGAAVKLLQRALNSVFRTYLGLEPLALDGVLGKQTRARVSLAVAQGKATELLAAYRKAAADRYIAIAATARNQDQNIGGWLRRAMELGDV
jgi:lysozyme family protein